MFNVLLCQVQRNSYRCGKQQCFCSVVIAALFIALIETQLLSRFHCNNKYPIFHTTNKHPILQNKDPLKSGQSTHANTVFLIQTLEIQVQILKWLNISNMKRLNCIIKISKSNKNNGHKFIFHKTRYPPKPHTYLLLLTARGTFSTPYIVSTHESGCLLWYNHMVLAVGVKLWLLWGKKIHLYLRMKICHIFQQGFL